LKNIKQSLSNSSISILKFIFQKQNEKKMTFYVINNNFDNMNN